MTDIDTLTRDLTSDVPDAAPEALARIRADVMARVASPPPRRPFLARRRLLPVAVGATALAAIAAGLVAGTRGGGPSLVERAEAAVTPPGEIVRIFATFRAPDVAEGAVVRDWTLAGDDGSLRMRRFISTGPEGEFPDDEDSVLELAADGRLTYAASWTPGDRTAGGPDRGTLTLGLPPEATPMANSWAGTLRGAYRDGSLRDTGASDGTRVLEGRIGQLDDTAGPGCAATQRVELDPATFEPSRMVLLRACDGGAAQEVGSITFRVDRLPATPANLGLLRMGSWPVTQAFRLDPATGEERPVPVQVAKREAGME